MKDEKQATNHGVKIRWMIRRDIPAVLDIDAMLYSHPMTEDELIQKLRGKRTIGMVCEYEESIVGFMTYNLRRNHLYTSQINVRPSWQCEGIGRAMLNKLKSKLQPHRRWRIVADVHEKNLRAQLFLKSCDFSAIATIKDLYTDPDTGLHDDIIRFQFCYYG